MKPGADHERRLVSLSENFRAGEFECRCGCGFGLAPGDVDPLLVDGLQRVRNILGVPLYVVRWDPVAEAYFVAGSGCRCQAHNQAVGGAKGSQHLKGKAADVWGPPVTLIKRAAEEVPCFMGGGIGLYPRGKFVHLDVRGYRARWFGNTKG